MGVNLKLVESFGQSAITPLIQALRVKGPELWGRFDLRQVMDGTPHHDTKTIALRWFESLKIGDIFNHQPVLDRLELDELPEARQLISTIVTAVEGGDVGRAFITSLKPEGRIDPHIDQGSYSDHYERFHLPLVTHQALNFFLVDEGDQVSEVATMGAGDLWWFNHKRTHWVTNQSETERIHLIVDVVAPKFRRQR